MRKLISLEQNSALKRITQVGFLAESRMRCYTGGMEKMGIFQVRFRISPTDGSGRYADLEGVVDTGAALPLIPRDILQSLGIKPKEEQTFILADGSRRRMGIGEVKLSYGKYEAICPVAFAPRGTQPLFGALALENLRLDVDPLNRRLKRTKLYLACAA